MRPFHPALFLVLTVGLGCTGDAFETKGGEGADGAGAAGGGAAGTGASATGGAGNSGTGATGNAGTGGAGNENVGGDGNGGAGRIGPGEDCKWGEGKKRCVDGYYCNAAQDCSNGVCAAIADDVVPSAMTAVCGCDGKIYWNVQTAQFYGMPAKNLIDKEGCGASTMACEDDTDCGGGSCALNCGSAIGQCWMLPPQCPAEPTTSVCQTGCTQSTPLCNAIVSSEPFDHACGG